MSGLRDVSRAAHQAAPIIKRMHDCMQRAVKGKPEVIKLALTCLFARGHLLIEDVPGVGKTTIARALARTVGGSFKRIQFTSDLLPSDILGVSVWDKNEGQFEFQKGPIFANVVLGDEINRTTPKTQSCLLEAMNDQTVSVDGRSYALEAPFLVVATQNPHEHHGTYPLPESQLDRFLMRLRIGYASSSIEREIIMGGQFLEDPSELEPVVETAEVLAIQAMVPRIHVDEAVLDYLMQLVTETRRSPFLDRGVSTRGARHLREVSQAYALVDGRDYVLPDDVKDLALPVLAHRVVPGSQADALGRGRDEAERALRDILERVPVPH